MKLTKQILSIVLALSLIFSISGCSVNFGDGGDISKADDKVKTKEVKAEDIVDVIEDLPKYDNESLNILIQLEVDVDSDTDKLEELLGETVDKDYAESVLEMLGEGTKVELEISNKDDELKRIKADLNQTGKVTMLIKDEKCYVDFDSIIALAGENGELPDDLDLSGKYFEVELNELDDTESIANLNIRDLMGLDNYKNAASKDICDIFVSNEKVDNRKYTLYKMILKDSVLKDYIEDETNLGDIDVDDVEMVLEIRKYKDSDAFECIEHITIGDSTLAINKYYSELEENIEMPSVDDIIDENTLSGMLTDSMFGDIDTDYPDDIDTDIDDNPEDEDIGSNDSSIGTTRYFDDLDIANMTTETANYRRYELNSLKLNKGGMVSKYRSLGEFTSSSAFESAVEAYEDELNLGLREFNEIEELDYNYTTSGMYSNFKDDTDIDYTVYISEDNYQTVELTFDMFDGKKIDYDEISKLAERYIGMQISSDAMESCIEEAASVRDTTGSESFAVYLYYGDYEMRFYTADDFISIGFEYTVS